MARFPRWPLLRHALRGVVLTGAAAALIALLAGCSAILVTPTATPPPFPARATQSAPATPATKNAPASPTVQAPPSQPVPPGGNPAPAPASPARSTEPSGLTAKLHVEVLSETIGKRVAATPGERAGAEYVADQLRSFGYRVEIQEFSYPSFVDEGSNVTHGGRTLAGNAMFLSGPGSVGGTLIAAGIGRAAEFPASIAGNIALVERGTITFQEKLDGAIAAGATGLVIYNNQAGAFAGSLAAPSAIPVVALARDEGRELATQAVGRQVTLEVRTRNARQTSWNVVADSDPSKASTVVIGGHMDGVEAGPGANDNASGTGAVIELGRALAGADYPFNVRLMAFGAEELGLVGSREYVKSLGDGARQIRAMLNLDMVGVGNSLRIGGDTDFARRARATVAASGIQAESLGGQGGSDHASFAQVGIPSLFFHVTNDPNYHTAEDQARFVDPANLEQAMRAVIAVLNTL